MIIFIRNNYFPNKRNINLYLSKNASESSLFNSDRIENGRSNRNKNNLKSPSNYSRSDLHISSKNYDDYNHQNNQNRSETSD